MSLVAALVASAALPAGADATTYYRVDASGTGSYNLNIDLSTESAVETSTVEATFGWTSFIAAVAFDDDGRIVGPTYAPERETEMTGELKRSIRVISKAAPDRAVIVDCEGSLVADQAMGANAMHGIDGHPTGVVFRPFSQVRFLDHRCTNGLREGFGIFEDGGDPHGIWEPGEFGEFDQVFELPKEAIGQGRIVQFVKPQSGQLMPMQCPTYSQAPGQRCTAKLDWAGSITFTKIDPDPDAIGPLTGPPPVPPRIDGPPAPAPKPAPRFPDVDPADDLIGPLVPPKATVDATGRTVSFRAGCATGCAGTAVVTAAGVARAAAAAKRRPLATLRFRVAAGAARTVRLKLPATVRRHLRRTRRASLAVTLRPAGGGAAKRTTLRIALPRR